MHHPILSIDRAEGSVLRPYEKVQNVPPPDPWTSLRLISECQPVPPPPVTARCLWPLVSPRVFLYFLAW